MTLRQSIASYFRGFSMPQGFILGRTESGNGPPHPIALDTLFNDPKYGNGGAGGGGSVTSVALTLDSGLYTVSGSPITSSGTLAGTLNTQSANVVFAGPSSGGAAKPTFRSLVTADIPNLSALYDLAGAAATAQSNAEAFAANASNISSGTIGSGRLPAATNSTLGAVETDGTTTIMSGNTISATVYAALALAFHPGYASGQFYDGSVMGASPSTSLFSANTLYAFPFYVAETTTFTKTQWRISGSGSGNYEIGIYNNANGAPTTLLQDLGSHSVTGTSLNSLSSLTITLTPGWYWVAIAFSSASGSGVYNLGTASNVFLLGSLDPNSATSGLPSASWAYSAGNLPANFPTITRVATVPRVQLGL